MKHDMKACFSLISLVVAAGIASGCQHTETSESMHLATGPTFSYVVVDPPDELTAPTAFFLVGRFTDTTLDEHRCNFTMANGKLIEVEYETGRQYWIRADLRIDVLESPFTHKDPHASLQF